METMRLRFFYLALYCITWSIWSFLHNTNPLTRNKKQKAPLLYTTLKVTKIVTEMKQKLISRSNIKKIIDNCNSKTMLSKQEDSFPGSV